MTTAEPKAWPASTEAIAGEIIPWHGDGKHQAHPIGPDDWPVIRRLKAAGKLGYSDDRVRRLAEQRR